MTSQLKTRDEELVSARDQIKELTGLVRNKGLGERNALNNQVQDLQNSLKKCEAQISLLNRKLELESRSSKHKLNAEVFKHKKAQADLVKALTEIELLSTMLEVIIYFHLHTQFNKKYLVRRRY